MMLKLVKATIYLLIILRPVMTGPMLDDDDEASQYMELFNDYGKIRDPLYYCYHCMVSTINRARGSSCHMPFFSHTTTIGCHRSSRCVKVYVERQNNYTLYRTCIAADMSCSIWERDLKVDGANVTCSTCKGNLCNGAQKLNNTLKFNFITAFSIIILYHWFITM